MGDEDVFGDMGKKLPDMFKNMAEAVNGVTAEAAQNRFLTGEHLADFAIAALSILHSETLSSEGAARWAANTAIKLNEILLSHMAQQVKPKKGEHDY